ncbi:MAG: PadR family transcriptional regulator [Actinomycetota bacterium]
MSGREVSRVSVAKVDVIVLGLLAEEPRYGYQLLERIRERRMGAWVEVGRASVYQALERLERGGAVTGRTQDSGTGPDRRVYELTALGRRRLADGVAERLGTPAPYQTEAGTALAFLATMASPDRRRALAAHEAALRAHRDDVRAAEALAPDRPTAALLARQAALADAELVWLEAHRKTLLR